MPTLAGVYIAIDLLTIGLAIPMILGKVPPNHWYGFRIPLTVDNPEIWYPANRYAGWLLVGGGIIDMAGTGLFALIPGISENECLILVTILLMVILLLVVILSIRRANVLAAGESGEEIVSSHADRESK